MSDILCRWLNLELGLSKVVEPHSFSKDFSSGYLLGEILSRYQLQDDFQHFTKNGTASAKLNNFTRLEPSLQLLGVAFDLGVAKSVMRGHPGAATRVLYQLYVLLQKKKRSGLTGTAMETMQPTATARLHRIENHIYNQRLRGVVKREVDERMQKITQRFDRKAQEGFGRSVMLELQQEEKRRHLQEEMRLQDIQKLQQVRRKKQEMMECIQTAAVQIPKPPVSRSLRAPRKRQQHEAQSVHQQIAQFEKNRKRPSPASCGPTALSVQVTRAVSEDEMAQWNSDYVQKIRQRLEEDANAREQREKRRRRALIQQLHTHHTHEEMIREEQLIGRLMRQSQQEKRMAVQLMQIRQQKEVLRQNRILQQRQFEEQRLADLQQILDQEAMVLEQTRLERQEELCKERELHARLAAERAQSKHQKHLNICRGILDQIVDLATKSAEYRLLTANVIPGKMLREWKELYFSGEPLYDGVMVEQEVEVEKQNILNQQDYSEYTNMTGEWAWPEEEGEIKAPPPNNDILGHVVARLRDIVNPPGPGDPPPQFPSFTLRACVLGKLCSGKTSCLTRINQVHGIHILSAEVLIQEALEAHQAGELDPESEEKMESSGSEEQVEEGAELPAAADSEPASDNPQSAEPLKQYSKTKRSLRAQYGAEVEKVLKRGGAVSDELLIGILIHAIRRVPEGQGWVLDGFPVNVSQAQLLEKALSGTEPDQADRKRWNQRPNLAKDRNAPKAPPPPSPALHLAMLLQVSDEQVVDRAVRRSQQVREENVAPAEDTLQTAPPAGEHTLIQHRIAEFQEAWPKLEKWFGEKQKILVKVSAELDEDSLFSSVESVLFNTINTTQKESLGYKDAEEKQSLEVQTAESGGAAGQTSVTSSSAMEEACSPTPGSVGWVYADEPLPKEIPEFLVGYWETVCSSYDSSVKAVMQNLRSERNLIIHHLYNTREDYKQYLQRPDLKQEFVCVWQRDYNSVPDNMRHDEETKTELHQRLGDLRECLWDICDKRKEEAEQKRAGVMEDGWLEDHTGLLINHYSTLLQVEVDRFQDTLNVLKDYYTGMYRTALPEAAEFTCIPLLDITDNNTQPNGTTGGPSPGSAPSEKHTKSAGKKEAEPEEKKNQNKKTKVVPLVEYRSPSTDPSALLQDIHHTAFTAITNMASVEVQRLECEVNKEQHVTTDKAQTHTDGSAARRSATKKSAKNKSPPTPVKQPTPPPAPVEESPEVVQRRAVRSRIRLEYSTALQHEESAVRQRMELVKLHALRTVQSIQHRAERTHTDLQEWLNQRFTSEINSIDRLAEVVKLHIEGGLKITHELVLECTDFFIDGETRMLPTPPPQPCPPPLERTNDSTLTVLQLHGLHAQLRRIAPAGLVSSKELCEFLQELSSLTMGSDALPGPWTNITDSQVQELVCVLVQDSGMVNWRHFLLSAAQPWPRPSQKQLLRTLRRFREKDTEARGVLTLQQYTQVELWFSGGRDVSVPDDPAEPVSYDRLTNLKQFFFTLFSDPDPIPPVLDYLTMLLYFCCHPDPAHGFTRALSLLTQHHLQHTHTGTGTSTLLKSVLYMDGGEECEAEEEDDGVYDEGDSVSLDELLRVLNHGRTPATSHHNKHTNDTEDIKQDLIKVFKDLGFDPKEKVPFSILSQHLFLQDLMESSNQYLLADIHTVLQLQKSEEEPSVFTAS